MVDFSKIVNRADANREQQREKVNIIIDEFKRGRQERPDLSVQQICEAIADEYNLHPVTIRGYLTNNGIEL